MKKLNTQLITDGINTVFGGDMEKCANAAKVVPTTLGHNIMFGRMKDVTLFKVAEALGLMDRPLRDFCVNVRPSCIDDEDGKRPSNHSDDGGVV